MYSIMAQRVAAVARGCKSLTVPRSRIVTGAVLGTPDMVKQPALVVLALIAGVALSSRPPASSTPPRAEANTSDTADDRSDTPDASASARDVVVLQREADGHFYADATVNGATIHFMVDTGASSVALTQADAQRAGMFFSANDFNQIGRGAGGEIALRSVSLDRVAVGNIEARDVRGVVIGGDGDMSLLGQSFLATLGGVSIEGDTMVLRPA
ncbi:TIGR02281 family clan AA aspartic protease [Sphingomonas sp. SUN039]|uniref:retropepsin-like aspartic protease family protein n=1 Tax=Sphingomonas sp. SUN039 TaxID=2937787 RepID=UPI0021648543|nr:TIGR02281 family clan AA aspartic protease [Sphingomonas sp. SUN039]UVO54916.1 TIGR02281 family clan AA aspartic protease [Sphingomonas sp. SUN039]